PHEVQGHGGFQVFNLPTEGVGQSREPPHAHPHGQVLPLDVGRADVLGVGVAGAALSHRPDALRRAVAGNSGAFRTVQLDQHGVVDFGAEDGLYGFDVDFVAVRR